MTSALRLHDRRRQEAVHADLAAHAPCVGYDIGKLMEHGREVLRSDPGRLSDKDRMDLEITARALIKHIGRAA